MNRRKQREHVFMMLFMCEFHEQEDLSEQEKLYTGELENVSEEDKKIVVKWADNVREKLPEIDSMLVEKIEGWSFKRIGKVELAILRLAVYEIMFDAVPKGVAINEAVEIAKKYGTDASSSFINGVLSKFSNPENQEQQ